jgi:Flp pilus assembly protein TadG
MCATGRHFSTPGQHPRVHPTYRTDQFTMQRSPHDRPTSTRRRGAFRLGIGRRAARRAVLVLQLLVVLPLLLIATLACFEFGMVFMIDQALQTAATQGARISAKGGNMTNVVTAVNQALSIYGIQIQPSTSDANIVLETGPATVTKYTSVPCTPAGPTLQSSPAETRVTVCLAYRAAASGSAWSHGSIPDWLQIFGFTWGTTQFRVSALCLTDQ